MRCFISIDITDEKIIESINDFQNKLSINARPVATQNLHFTIMFLGNITELQKDQIEHVLNNISFESFELKLVGVGAFPNTNYPRIIWVGTDKHGQNKLLELVRMIQQSLEVLGFKNEKPFKSHITIFRVKNKIQKNSPDLKKFASKEFGTQLVNEIKFKKSVLTPQGPIYSDLMVVRAKK